MDKKWMILTCFFSVVTLIASIASSCLVFFNEESRTKLHSDTIIAENKIYKNVSIVYENSNVIKLSNISPGYNITQKFNITNNNSNTINYRIEWSNVTSTWNNENSITTPHPEEFVYSVSCTNGEKIENKTMPYNNENNVILDNLELKTNKSNECTLTIKFIQNGTDQSYNLNKLFGGTYKVVVKD